MSIDRSQQGLSVGMLCVYVATLLRELGRWETAFPMFCALLSFVGGYVYKVTVLIDYDSIDLYKVYRMVCCFRMYVLHLRSQDNGNFPSLSPQCFCTEVSMRTVSVLNMSIDSSELDLSVGMLCVYVATLLRELGRWETAFPMFCTFLGCYVCTT
jgi:uncharacterized membrane protein